MIDRRAKDYIPREFGAMIYEDAKIVWQRTEKRYKWGCTCGKGYCKHKRRIKKLLIKQEKKLCQNKEK